MFKHTPNANPAKLLLLAATLLFCTLFVVSESDEVVGYGYRVVRAKVDSSSNRLTALLKLINASSLYGQDIPNLTFTATFEKDYRLRIRITDAEKPRWEIPNEVLHRDGSSHGHQPLDSRPTTPPSAAVLTHPNSDLIFRLHDTNPFGFSVTRRSTNDVLFDTRSADPETDPVGLVFKDQYIQLSSSLPADRSNLYGIGEHTKPTFRLARNQTLTLWNAKNIKFIIAG